MEYWRLSCLGLVLAVVAIACEGTSQHSECDIYHGITCYFNVAYTYGVHTLIPIPGYEERYFNKSDCPRLPEQHQLEPCTQFYSHCDEETKKKFEACEKTYQSIRELLGDRDKCLELTLLRECINHDKLQDCQVHFYLGPSLQSAKANLNASVKLRQCLGEALEPCSDERMVQPKKSVEALVESVGALFRYLEIPLVGGDVKPNNSMKKAGQLSILSYAQKSPSEYESTTNVTTTELTQKERGDSYHHESSAIIPVAESGLMAQSLIPVSVTPNQGIPSSDVESTTTADMSFTTLASGNSKQGELGDTTAGASKHIDCNVFRATGCYWTAAWIYGVSTLIPTAGHEEQYLSQSHCPKNATMEAKRIPLLWKHFIRPQQAPAEAECTRHYNTCSKETKATFAEHEEAYESLRQVIADHAKCRGLSQLRKCIKQDTMKNCSVHVSIVPLMGSAEENLRASTNLRLCLEEALEPCSAGNMTEPKRLARFITTSVSVLLRKPVKPLQKDDVESRTTTTTSLRSSEVPVATSTSNHEHSYSHTSHAFSNGSQSTTVQPLESISTNKPSSQSDQATTHREPGSPLEASTETQPDPTASPQSGTRTPAHQPEGSTPAAQSEDTSSPQSRTYKPVHHPYDAGTATESEPTSAPSSGVSATSAPAISALVSLVVLSLAQAFRACT